MSEENVEIILRGVEAANRRDADAFVADLSPDVEWENSIFWSEGSRTYRGIGELREWFNQVVIEPWETLRIEIEEITEAPDDRVFFGMLLTARGKDSGVDTRQHAWSVQWFAGGKVTRRKVFLDRAEALEAAGIQERAMSQENVETVRRSIDAFNRGDRDAWLADFAPEAEWHTTGRFADAGVYRGRAGLERFWAELQEDMEELRVSVSDIRATGDRVFVAGKGGGRGKRSKAHAEELIWYAVTLRDRRIVRVQGFATQDEALEAAGLRE